MDDWREETGGDIGTADRLIAELSASLSGEPSAEQLRSIWQAYLLVEKSVAFIKLELDEENPGKFVNPKAYLVPDERQAMGIALRFLREAERSFKEGDLLSSLRSLRESRNYLRVLIREKRRVKVRKARAASKQA